ncbi:pyrroline-5-carboxylate reductase dimerization domain-containing protein [Leuconostoc suionicum]|uniref:pyrroline-5-carboxylate reductase dimerization domain-containing protein n=1 Tax=Leuconostoc suionicum TaxID=1511761 RepID=UPI002FEE482A
MKIVHFFSIRASKTDESPWQLIDKVSSPGGTTVAGILKMIEKGFISDVVDTIDETVKKDESLG